VTFEVLSLFPEAFSGFVNSSIVARAIASEAVGIRFTDFRHFSENKHHKVDDYPYGGFAGMVIQAQPVYDAIQSLVLDSPAPVIYFTPQGRPLTQKLLSDYALSPRVILLCGHYKELDQRVRDMCVSDEISLGDYVLSGGELAAMVFIDGVSRLLPGVLGDIDSAHSDSFSVPGLGFPCWTRPESFMGMDVPEVLKGGNHKKINEWVQNQAKTLTSTRRPDLTNKK